MRIHVVKLGQIRSAAVNKPLGEDFNVIKVVCILFFRTTSIRTHVQTKPINTENISKRQKLQTNVCLPRVTY